MVLFVRPYLLKSIYHCDRNVLHICAIFALAWIRMVDCDSTILHKENFIDLTADCHSLPWCKFAGVNLLEQEMGPFYCSRLLWVILWIDSIDIIFIYLICCYIPMLLIFFTVYRISTMTPSPPQSLDPRFIEHNKV